MARLAGASPGAMQEAIDAIEPLPHRLALVAERAGVRWFDDSKATNVGATVKSLESFPGPVVLLAGGLDKGGDYGPLVARRLAARCAWRWSSARPATLIADALAGGGVAVERVDDLGAAVRAAAAAARPGDTVLLAPACASFDMFTRLRGTRPRLPRRGGGPRMNPSDTALDAARRATRPVQVVQAPLGHDRRSAVRSTTSGPASCAGSSPTRGSCSPSSGSLGLGIVMVFNTSYFCGQRALRRSVPLLPQARDRRSRSGWRHAASPRASRPSA